jgi:PAS domain-containing protein
MVSLLSSRIMNAEAKANSKYRPLTAANVLGEWGQLRGAKKRDASTSTSNGSGSGSGYSADRSESPPDSLSSMQHSTTTTYESLVKKRKTEVDTFQAFNVKNDLAKAGVQCLPGLRSRALPRGSVDMSRVKLVLSSKDNPYLGDQCEPGHGNGNGNGHGHTTRIHSSEDYSDLFKATQQFYTSDQSIPAFSEEGTSTLGSDSTSNSISTSPSDSESESVDFQHKDEKNMVGDMIMSMNYDTSSNVYCNHITKHLNPSNTLTLCNALFYDSPRLIVDCHHSLTIIHSNAAFSQLTGLSSDKVIGKSVQSIFDTDATDSDMSMNMNVQGGGGGDSGKILTLRDNDASSFAFTVTPVVNNARISHYVIDFSEVASNATGTGTGSATVNATTAGTGTATVNPKAESCKQPPVPFRVNVVG